MRRPAGAKMTYSGIPRPGVAGYVALEFLFTSLDMWRPRRPGRAFAFAADEPALSLGRIHIEDGEDVRAEVLQAGARARRPRRERRGGHAKEVPRRWARSLNAGAGRGRSHRGRSHESRCRCVAQARTPCGSDGYHTR